MAVARCSAKLVTEVPGLSGNSVAWQLCCDEDIFAIASPMRLNVAARIAVPESLVVVSHLRGVALTCEHDFRIALKLAINQDDAESFP